MKILELIYIIAKTKKTIFTKTDLTRLNVIPFAKEDQYAIL